MRYTKKDISLKRIIYDVAAILCGVTAAIGMSSCSEYQMLLKERNSELWYRKGLEYYNKGEYVKAANLLGGVVTAYTGTSKADTVTLYYANSLVKIEDYYTAAHYFQNYVKTFPSSDFSEDCQYMTGYCYYNLSPKVDLDQSDTETCITELQTYMNMYPNGKKIAEAEKMMKEMENKLALKAYMSAKLYFDLGDYMGNNYNSAVIIAQNCLRKYPDTEHREELSFLILEAKFIQAERSIITKQSERYRDAIDEYYSFINEYPTSRYSKKAKQILASSEEGLKEAEKIAPPSEDDLNYYRNFGNQSVKRVYQDGQQNQSDFND